MGADTTRITAADFLTPPELAHLKLAADGTGRIGGVRLTLAAADDRTHVRHCYQQVPLHARWLDLGPRQPLLVYLLNPTAGLLDGDGQLIQLHARSGTRAVVVGQSAGRVHPAVHGFATQQWHVHVEDGAVLVVIPGPSIPYRKCRYFGRAAVDLDVAAHLIWGDIWLAGRHAEQFQFERWLQELTVRRAGRLVFRDRFCWEGPWPRDTALWHVSGQPACGTLYVTGQLAAACVRQCPEVGTAIFPTAAGDTLMRWCGTTEAVTGCLVRTALAAAGACAGRDANSWLLSENCLAPNHWFVPTGAS